MYRKADQRLHVIQVELQLAPTHLRQRVLGPRHSALERFFTRDVPGVLEPSRVRAQVAVRGAEQLLEVGERERTVYGERAHDTEPDPLVNQPIER